MLTKKNSDEDYKIIWQGNVVNPDGGLEAELLIYYGVKTNSIYLNMKGSGREDFVFDSKIKRGESDWDKAAITLELTRDFRVENIKHKITNMGLSRTMMAIIIYDAKIGSQIPQLYDVLKEYLLFPEINDEIRDDERIDSSIVPLSLILKARNEPGEISEQDIRRIKSIVAYKSWAIKNLGFQALEQLRFAGKVSDEEVKLCAEKSLRNSIREDLSYATRLLKYDGDFLRQALKNLYNFELKPNSIKEIRIGYVAKGNNKQVYKVCIELLNNHKFSIALSVIRFGDLGVEFNQKAIGWAMENWQELSSYNREDAVVLGNYRWIEDYRPRYSDISYLFTSRWEGGIDVNRLIYNNVVLVLREFKEGNDLSEILQNGAIPEGEKANATKEALRTYLNIFIKSKDRRFIIGDPKPSNIVLNYQNGRFNAKCIDLDGLFSGESIERYVSCMLNFGYNPEIVSKVLKELGLDVVVIGNQVSSTSLNSAAIKGRISSSSPVAAEINKIFGLPRNILLNLPNANLEEMVARVIGMDESEGVLDTLDEPFSDYKGEPIGNNVIFVEEHRIIHQSKVFDEAGRYEADLLVYYSLIENSIYVLIRSALGNELVPGETITRKELGWEKSEITIRLDKEYNIKTVVSKRGFMYLSRSMISIILKDAKLERLFPDLYRVIDFYLVLPAATQKVREREILDSQMVPLSLVNKAYRSQDFTENELVDLKLFVEYKSRALRQKALEALEKLQKIGKVNGEEVEAIRRKGMLFDIEEDLAFMARLFRENKKFLSAALERLFGYLDGESVESIEILGYWGAAIIKKFIVWE